MKKILIGSVFANDSDLQKRWLDLQLKYIQETTKDFDHISVVMQGDGTNLIGRETNIVVSHNQSLQDSDAHLFGLELLRNIFTQHKDQYQNFLFLDSDAFPIKKNWINVLLKTMTPSNDEIFDDALFQTYESKQRNYEIAIAVRSENLETRLHSSILFVKQSALQHLNFKIGVMGKDLLNNPEEDIHLPVYESERRDFVLPLIRTNQYNCHPLSCGIYFDMFYHHCCGSRTFNMRGKKYFSSIVQVDDLSHLTDRLFNSPSKFINKLAGWNQIWYPSDKNFCFVN